MRQYGVGLIPGTTRLLRTTLSTNERCPYFTRATFNGLVEYCFGDGLIKSENLILC